MTAIYEHFQLRPEQVLSFNCVQERAPVKGGKKNDWDKVKREKGKGSRGDMNARVARVVWWAWGQGEDTGRKENLK